MITCNKINKQLYYQGYISNSTKMLKYEEEKYNLYVNSDNHLYKEDLSTEVFDENKQSLGIFYKENNFRKSENRIVNKQLNVFQINYDFFLLPVGDCKTIDEIYDIENILKNSFDLKFSDISRDNIRNCINYFFGKELNIYHEEPFEAIEICAKGHTRNIALKKYRSFFDLKISDYTKNKKEFIKKHPEFTEQVECLYKINIGFLSLFWGVNSKALLRDEFCRKKLAINKLNRKITNKINKS